MPRKNAAILFEGSEKNGNHLFVLPCIPTRKGGGEVGLVCSPGQHTDNRSNCIEVRWMKNGSHKMKELFFGLLKECSKSDLMDVETINKHKKGSTLWVGQSISKIITN